MGSGKNNIKVNNMKKEYDFSKGERGRFYKDNSIINLPVYLDSDNLRFVEKIARDKKSDLNTIVNQLIKENIKIAQVLR